MSKPGDWRAMTLSDVVTSQWGGTTFRTKEYGDSGTPVLTKGDVKPGGVVTHGGKYVDTAYAEEKRYKFTRPGDFIVTTRDLSTAANFLGLLSPVPKDRRFLVNQGSSVLRIDADILDPRYFVHWCCGDVYRGYVKGHYSGATQIHIRQKDLMNAPVWVPPLPIQRKIASILSAYDDLIGNNTRRITILEKMAQAIYREWFVNFRFPGHENVKLVESRLGQIPGGWEVTTLAEIADVNSRSIKKGNAPDNINYIDIKSVSTGRIDEIRPMPFSDSPGRARRIVRHGDVIWSTVRPVRRSYSIILDPLPDTIASTGFAVLSAENVPFSYVYFATTTDEFATYLVNHATGSAYPAVNGKDFENADVILPPSDVLAQFDNAVGGMLVLGHRLLVKNINLRNTRDLLLPKLISGKLDVEDLDIEVGTTAETLEEATA